MLHTAKERHQEKSGVARLSLFHKAKPATYLLLRTAARLSSFHRKAKRLAFKAVLQCIGGDLSAVVDSASRRPRTFGVLSEGR